MLYQLHEWQRRLLTPLSSWAQATSQLFSNPYSPLSYTIYSRRLAASYDLLYRLGKHYEKPEFGIRATTVDGVEVPVNQVVACEKAFCRLLHFERDLSELPQSRPRDPRVLIVAPLSGHHSTLLRDTVRTLLPTHDLYVTDWTNARMVPLSKGPFHLDDYVDYVIEFLDLIGPGSHVISVCQPTVPVLGAVSLMASRGDAALPRSMTMMGGPIDTRRNPTQVNALAKRKSLDWFRNTVIFKVPSTYPGYLREVYPGFLQHAGFVAMNPDRHVNSHWEYYLDTIRIVFQEHRLPQGTWHVRGERVAPEAIRNVGLFTIEGELDDISGSGQTQAALELCRGIPESNKRHLTAIGVGHYGIFSGRRWREMISPQIAQFIRAHDQ